jgi:hypothetical protein
MAGDWLVASQFSRRCSRAPAIGHADAASARRSAWAVPGGSCWRLPVFMSARAQVQPVPGPGGGRAGAVSPIVARAAEEGESDRTSDEYSKV